MDVATALKDGSLFGFVSFEKFTEHGVPKKPRKFSYRIAMEELCDNRNRALVLPAYNAGARRKALERRASSAMDAILFLFNCRFYLSYVAGLFQIIFTVQAYSSARPLSHVNCVNC